RDLNGVALVGDAAREQHLRDVGKPGRGRRHHCHGRIIARVWSWCSHRLTPLSATLLLGVADRKLRRSSRVFSFKVTLSLPLRNCAHDKTDSVRYHEDRSMRSTEEVPVPLCPAWLATCVCRWPSRASALPANWPFAAISWSRLQSSFSGSASCSRSTG